MVYPQKIVELDENSRYLVVAKIETENSKLPAEAIARLSTQIETALGELLGSEVKVLITDNVSLDLDFTQFKPEVNHG